MTATQDDVIAELQRANAELRREHHMREVERDTALARQATLAEELAARDATLAQRNTEYSERIEQQSATIDVLKVMSSSPGNAQPIFELIVERARAFCGADQCTVALLDGDMLHLKAKAGMSEASARNYAAQFPRPVNTASMFGRAILAQEAVQTPDVLADPEHFSRMRVGGPDPEFRAIVAVPMLRAGTPIGAIALVRKMPGIYPAIQMELLQTFAEQAVIAITSAETYRALQTRTSDLLETLEYQTAISDVLKVISRSAFDLQPVLDTVVETAARLCDADNNSIATRDGEVYRIVASFGLTPQWNALVRTLSFRPGRDTITGRTLLERQVNQIADITADPEYRLTGAATVGNLRTVLGVPLLREGNAIGVMQLSRCHVEPFTERQIELVRTFADQAVIAMENARLITEQREALEQQTATAEVLQVINASPGNLPPVFDAMLEKALRLCGAAFGNLWTYDGEVGRLAAICGASPEYRAELMLAGPQKPEPGGSLIRLVEGEPLVHIADITAEGAHRSGATVRRMLADRAGARTVLWVPMRKDGALLGFFTIYRTEVRPFTNKQIALLQNFAEQAVIAMENARLLTEQREALERQTATAEVLQAINGNPGDLTPVFDAILEKAHNLIGAAIGALVLYEGPQFRAVATHGFSEQHNTLVRQLHGPTPGHLELLAGRRFKHYHDLRSIEDGQHDAVTRSHVENNNARTALWVPLRKDNRLLGLISVYRLEVRPFLEKEIALLENFAAQAVIAMENARLLTEQREALEQQTATSDVLQIINASPGNLEPVFDALLEKSLRLCEAEIGLLHTYDGDLLRLVATRGVPPTLVDYLMEPHRPPPGGYMHRIVQGENVVHLNDVKDSDAYRSGDEARRAFVDLGGARTAVYVALRKDNTLFGVMVIFRQEVRAFSDKSIALLRNFAAQAVIAMENARLLTEQQEALERQTAMAEVLAVINANPGELGPVFDMILEKAHRLCDIAMGALLICEAGQRRAVATRGYSPEADAHARRLRPIPDNLAALAKSGAVLHDPDVSRADGPLSGDFGRTFIAMTGARTYLVVPLSKEGTLLGTITAVRNEVRPFTERQITLLRNFAAQAVIAMENARLINEQREALEQQTATAEVLQVINASPGNLAPVFDAMLEKALNLCGAAFGILLTYDGERFHHTAFRSIPSAYVEFMREHPPIYAPESAPGRLALGERLVHLLDITDTDAYRSGDANRRAIADLAGARTIATVSLRKDSALVGAIAVFRQEVRPFSDKQIALLQNFAEQAVIAMENARLITEQREALEQQTATAEVLQVINASPGNLAPVFDALLEKAIRLCGSAFGTLQTYDGQIMRAVATRGLTPEQEVLLVDRPPAAGQPTGRIASGEDVVHLLDAREQDGYRVGFGPTRFFVDQVGARTVMWVALRKDKELLGILTIFRKEVRAFTEKEVELVQSFAAQAVIAMENARLLNEQREALEQQTATAEVLQVINTSPGDLAPVFDAMLQRATRLCGTEIGSFWSYNGETFQVLASTIGDTGRTVQPDQGTRLWRIAHGESVVQIADIETEPAYRVNAVGQMRTRLAGTRTALAVALRKDETLVGAILTGRLEVRPFTDKEIALLENLAAQAVIAMENARLLTEQREALEQRTATAEVLQVINANPGNLAPVFDAILDKAHTLCGAVIGSLVLFDGTHFRAVATHGFPEQVASLLRHPVPPNSNTQELIDGVRFHQIEDIRAIWINPDRLTMRALVEYTDVRTVLFVPLRKDGALLGFISAYRPEVRAFSEKEIALLENFAAQAVIAIENTRLITEQREALEQQTATAEVLQVINSSPGDLAPVFDAMLEKAMRVCEAAFGALFSYDGEHLRVTAVHGVPTALERFLRQGPHRPSGFLLRLLHAEPFEQIADLTLTGAYRAGEPLIRNGVDLGGMRTHLAVPLRKDGKVLGLIAVYRQEVRLFTSKQIALLQNFASQAVIAMENARLLTEQQEALDQQTATAEVLQVINASPGNLAPVFDAMLEKAIRLCQAEFGTLRTWDGERFHLGAAHGDPRLIEWTRRHGPFTPDGDAPLARIVRGEEVVRITDDQLAAYQTSSGFGAMAAAIGFRSGITLALRKDATLLGTITVYRKNEDQPFTDKQVALLQNFAAQAVIAMENARLLEEIRQRQAELRVTFDNMGDGVVMFDAEHRLAAWNRNFQQLLDVPDAMLAERPSYADYLSLLAEQGEFGTDDVEAELARRLGDTDRELRLERTRPDGRVIEVRRNAVSGGGFVLIYGDITERKRSEEQIRAARDAAEAALRELRTAQANLIQAEKMASLGQLTAGIAHEIKNPLNFVNNFAALSVDLLSELKETAAPGFATLTEKQRAEVEDVSAMLTSNLEKITEHGKRADGIVKAMLEHSRGSSGERRMVDLNALIDEALNLAYHGARAQDQSFNITLERDFGEGIAPIEVNPQDITRVFLNLFANGFYAVTRRARDGGDAAFVPTLKVTTIDAGEAVEIRVRDNGTGIPADIRDKLFQPFFTTKPTGEGTGLGLSITYDIVTQQHGGSIAVGSKVGEYSEFTIRLPCKP